MQNQILHPTSSLDLNLSKNTGRYVENKNQKSSFFMTNMSIQPLWLTDFIEILLVLEFQLTKTYFGTFSYKAHFRPQISSNVIWKCKLKILHNSNPSMPFHKEIPLKFSTLTALIGIS